MVGRRELRSLVPPYCYSRLIVSSKLRMALARSVHAARSTASPSPLPAIFSASSSFAAIPRRAFRERVNSPAITVFAVAYFPSQRTVSPFRRNARRLRREHAWAAELFGQETANSQE